MPIFNLSDFVVPTYSVKVGEQSLTFSVLNIEQRGYVQEAIKQTIPDPKAEAERLCRALDARAGSSAYEGIYKEAQRQATFFYPPQLESDEGQQKWFENQDIQALIVFESLKPKHPDITTEQARFFVQHYTWVNLLPLLVFAISGARPGENDPKKGAVASTG